MFKFAFYYFSTPKNVKIKLKTKLCVSSLINFDTNFLENVRISTVICFYDSKIATKNYPLLELYYIFKSYRLFKLSSTVPFVICEMYRCGL